MRSRCVERGSVLSHRHPLWSGLCRTGQGRGVRPARPQPERPPPSSSEEGTGPLCPPPSSARSGPVLSGWVPDHRKGCYRSSGVRPALAPESGVRLHPLSHISLVAVCPGTRLGLAR